MMKWIKIMMTKAMNTVMLSCDVATSLITKSAYTKLEFKESIQLKMHLMGCKMCRIFNVQNEHLTIQINKFTQQNHEKLSEDKKTEIKNVMAKQ